MGLFSLDGASAVVLVLLLLALALVVTGVRSVPQDSEFTVERVGPPLPAGAAMRIVGAEGPVLQVVPHPDAANAAGVPREEGSPPAA